MARAQYSEVVTFVDDTTGALMPASNARVSVYQPGTTTLVTIYTTRSAGTTKSNPFTTDLTGGSEFWADWGDYDIKYEDLDVPARFGSKTFGWASTSGSNAAIPLASLDAIATRQFDPVGSVTMWWRPDASVTLPTGWVQCDGATYSSGNHDFGTGASIVVPDMRNKFVLGASSTQTDGQAAAAGDTTANAPGIRGTGSSHSRNLQHTHTISAESPGTNAAGSHAHNFSGTTGGNSAVYDSAQRYTSGSAQKIIATHTHPFSGSTDSQGSHSHTVNSHSHGGATGSTLSATQDIKPLYVGLLFIIKIKRS